MPTPVTDPDVLAQLNAPQPVTDPATLAQLNGQYQDPDFMQWLGNTFPARIAKGVYSGMKLPGDVYSGQTQVDPSNPQFMGRVMNLAGVAPVGSIPTVASQVAPSIKELVQTGGQQIEGAVKSGQPFSPDAIQSGIDAIRQKIPSPRTAEDTHAALDSLEQQTGPITFQDLKNTRDELMDVQYNAAKSNSRTAATDLRASTIAKHGIDDIIQSSETPEATQFAEGNANVTAGKQAETLDQRLYKSELRAAAANSGMNVGNTVRSNVASMLLSKDARGLSPDATQAAENVVYGSGPENFMRTWGNRLGGGGGLGQSVLAGGAGALGYLGSGGSPTVAGIAGVGLPMIGALLRHGSNSLALSHLDALSNMLRANSPLGKGVTTGAYPGSVEGAAAAKQALIRVLMAGGNAQTQ